MPACGMQHAALVMLRFADGCIGSHRPRPRRLHFYPPPPAHVHDEII